MFISLEGGEEEWGADLLLLSLPFHKVQSTVSLPSLRCHEHVKRWSYIDAYYFRVIARLLHRVLGTEKSGGVGNCLW